MPLALPGEPTSVEVALHLLRHGVQPIPMPIRSKNPGLLLGPGWDQVRYTEAEIPAAFEGRNVGFFTGEISGDLADLDLDCPESVQLADAYFPRTLAFGRPGRLRSHRLFRAPGAQHMKLVDPVPGPDGKPVTIVELRFGRKDSGKQTVIFGEHEDTGEPIRFSAEDPQNPTEVDGAWLSGEVRAFAAVVLLVRRGATDLINAAANKTLDRATLLARMDPSSAGKVGDWLDLPRPQSPAREERKASTASADLSQAVAAYNEDNRREYPRAGECPVCGSETSFKQHPENPAKWVCFSTRGHNGCGTLVTSSGDPHYIGDALDLDAYAAGRKRTEHLRAAGYLSERKAEPQPKAAPPPDPTTGLDPRSIAHDLETYLRVMADGVPRLATNFPLLDAGLDGGIPVRGLTVIGGPPKASKSTLVRHLVVQHVLAGGIAYVRDFEDAPFYRLKILCSLARLGPAAYAADMRAGDPRRWANAIGMMLNGLRELHLEPAATVRQVNNLAGDVEHFLGMAGKRPLLVVIDSLQKVPVKDLSDRRAGLDEFLRHLEHLKNTYPVAIVATSELSRSKHGRGYESFKESGDIEYTADLAMLLEHDEEPSEGTIHEETRASDYGPRSTLRVVSNRQGRTGRVAHYRARFPFYGFEESALVDDGAPRKGRK
jgi:hypothetical protein